MLSFRDCTIFGNPLCWKRWKAIMQSCILFLGLRWIYTVHTALKSHKSAIALTLEGSSNGALTLISPISNFISSIQEIPNLPWDSRNPSLIWIGFCTQNLLVTQTLERSLTPQWFGTPVALNILSDSRRACVQQRRARGLRRGQGRDGGRVLRCRFQPAELQLWGMVCVMSVASVLPITVNATIICGSGFKRWWQIRQTEVRFSLAVVFQQLRGLHQGAAF